MELNQGTYGGLCQVWDAEVRFALSGGKHKDEASESSGTLDFQALKG